MYIYTIFIYKKFKEILRLCTCFVKPRFVSCNYTNEEGVYEKVL